MNNFEEKLKKEIEDFKNYWEADRVVRGKDWKGYQIYIKQYDKQVCLGYPIILMANPLTGEIRQSTDEESLDYIDFFN